MTQVYFDDVKEGQEIPTLVQHCDARRLVYYGASTNDYYELHYDKDFAVSTGLEDRIVHGALKHALLGRLLQEWVGDEGMVRRVACNYRGMDLINTDIVCRGFVTGKRQENGMNIVELDVWTEAPDGKKTTPATAEVTLPSRG